MKKKRTSAGMHLCIIHILLIVFLLQITTIVFAQNTIGVTDISWDVSDGYTIFSGGKNTYIINNCGQVINQWRSQYKVSNSAYLLDNGNLLRTASKDAIPYSMGGLIEEYNWEGELIWTYEIDDDDYIQHHDIEPLPNGNILVLCYNFKQPIEAWDAGALDTLEYWSTSVFEISPKKNNDANIVWEWHLWDHLYQDLDSTRANYNAQNPPELFNINYMNFPNDTTIFTADSDIGPDWMHMNSIDYNEQRDEILLSSRDQNEIFILDHSTNSTEAAGHSGGKQNMGGDFIYRYGRTRFYGQHDAHWINKYDYDDNAIVIFNNGFKYNSQSRSYSSVDVLVPRIDPNDKYVHNEVDVYEVILKLDDPNGEYSRYMGSAQILDNNRVLMCNSYTRSFLEFDLNRNMKWKYVSPLTSTGINTQGNTPSSPLIFNAKRLPIDHPAIIDNLNVGNPIELNFDIADCLGTTNILTTIADEDITLYPNPATDFITLQPKQNISILNIHNNFGQVFELHKIDDDIWDVSDLPSGLYFLRFPDMNGAIKAKKVVIDHR